jgi:hypothetical protein
MAATQTRYRYSRDGKTEYQLEFKEKSRGNLSEYRVRRGARRGTWTKWYCTMDTGKLLKALGFVNHASTMWLEDFYFESYFGRGEIQLSSRMFGFIVDGAGIIPACTHFYARAKKNDDGNWIIPTSAIETRSLFEALRDIVKNNQ